MKYIINYTKEGKIIGFYNEEQQSNLNIQVDNQTWFNNMGMTKIIIDGENISFDNVDWRSSEETRNQEQIKFRMQRDNLLNEADIEINKLDDNFKDSSKWREYRQALRDATISWELPIRPPKEV